MSSAIYNVLHTTIKAVYAKYYPKEVVDFFCQHHSKEHILDGIASGNMGVLFENGAIVGNNCVIKNSIILNDVYIGDNTYIENCIVESRDTIRANTRHVGENDIKIVIEKNERYAI